ncbi:MAG: LytTR family DNA-binding domain-containing protein [Bacteroidales bacterium]|nr:LytTR family DNA-binding domain-containing protein [Bacteroidales bacterium]
MNLTCIVIDDEPPAVELIKSFINRTPFLECVGGYTDSVEAIQIIKDNPPDILFCDIQMPDLDGMQLSKMVPTSTKIVFTTAYKEYAFDSYDVAAIDYLLKPISYAKFLNAAQKCQEWYEMKNSAENSQQNTAFSQNQSNDTFFVKSDSMLVRVDASEILYVTALKDYVRFVFDSNRKPIISLMTMKNVENLLPKNDFMRVSRSYIVSLSKIRSVDKNNCIYIGNEIIHVTDVYSEQFKKFINFSS